MSFLLPLEDDPKVEKYFTETADSKQENGEDSECCEDVMAFIRKSFLVLLASFYVVIQIFLPWSHFITQVCTEHKTFFFKIFKFC